MSRVPGDDLPATDSSRSSGIANVFRGLASSKSTKSLPIAASSSSSSLAIPPGELSASPRTLSSTHMDAFDRLRNGKLNERIAACQTLKFAISEYPLNPVLDIWYAAKDLIEPSQPCEARTAAWELLSQCVKHPGSTDLERKEFFQTLSAAASPEDFHLQLAAMSDLTASGRVLNGFDYELLPLLTRWLQETYDAVRQARRSQASRTKSASKARAAVSGEERNFHSLFVFLTDVVKFSFNNADETAVAGLLDCLLRICKSTSVADDLKSSIALVDAIVTFGSIPSQRLEACVHVLGSIFTLVPASAKDAWRTLSHLCRSHYGQAIVRMLLDILRNLSPTHVIDAEVSRRIKGALAVLHKLLTKTSEKGYPAVPYALLVDGLANAVEATSSHRVHAGVLEIIDTLLGSGDDPVHSSMVEEDWSAALNVAVTCYSRLEPETDETAILQSKDEQGAETIRLELQQLADRLNVLLEGKPNDFIPRQSIINFFVDVHPLLSEDAATTLLDYLRDFRCCSPLDSDWEKNLSIVLDGFFRNRDRTAATRLRALGTIKDAYEVVDLVGASAEQDFIPHFTRSLLQDIGDEADVVILESTLDLLSTVSAHCSMELFDEIVAVLRSIVVNDRLKSPVTSATLPRTSSSGTLDKQHYPLEPSTSNVAARTSVKMFLLTMNIDSAKAVKLYSSLVGIARSNLCEADARITAMKLLFRLRSDWANRIFVTNDPDTAQSAATLGRTKDALLHRQSDETTLLSRPSRGEHQLPTRAARGKSFSQNPFQERGIPVRSASGPKPTGGKATHMWKVPDPAALPVPPPDLVSPVLSSHRDRGSDATASLRSDVGDQPLSESPLGTIDSSSWMETILLVLKGCDWEVYSFVLVHLPAQMLNHTFFADAVGQMQDMRRLLCEQIKLNTIQEPPFASGLRRADVAICVFHILTALLSYHEHLHKGDEDELVRTFGLGITQWERTAKCCIHALSMCCHELPLSISKSLTQTLNQMATIITQPSIAIHILEFLASLSRIQSVYVNFREDEYKTIFGVCFRYLEYTRDKQRSNRSSSAHEIAPFSFSGTNSMEASRPSASDDLPQYVYALAYHVLIFWFLALKLQDRAVYAGWITKRLFSDVDSPGAAPDDYALTTIDFMQRVCYADVDESAEDTNFTEERFGEIQKRRWLIGNTIVTIKQATVSGWAQIVKRQPSGISSYLIRESFQPPPPHQAQSYVDVSREGQWTKNNILPSHLLIQLMSPSPQTWEASRPIPLPSDDATERAIRVLDRNSTVDGHKIGVIYIGEGQTNEIDILANVAGSSDYAVFLNGLGTLTRLKGAKFNPQGLDRDHDSDGEYTYCWRDRVTEMVFHVTTQMPTDKERDPQLAQKKKHIGNDFVNIVFNDSGLPFDFDTFPSQFNYVYIVITPACRATFAATRAAAEWRREGLSGPQPFYTVQVISKPGFPEISPASEPRMVSLAALPSFVRLLALNASVFSMVWEKRTGGEHVSSWRSRLREIRRLREKHVAIMKAAAEAAAGGGTQGQGQQQQQQQQSQPQGQVQQLQQQQQNEASRPSTSVRDSLTSLRRTSVATFFTTTTSSEQPSHRSSTISTSNATTDTETGANGSEWVMDSVDFSRWA
ncbi:rap/ran-GAP domain-containing protein [Sarocladium implicatum]|nr:rap/ran-GAP domain-containing protein [Sarocladium implicatum]